MGNDNSMKADATGFDICVMWGDFGDDVSETKKLICILFPRVQFDCVNAKGASVMLGKPLVIEGNDPASWLLSLWSAISSKEVVLDLVKFIIIRLGLSPRPLRTYRIGNARKQTDV